MTKIGRIFWAETIEPRDERSTGWRQTTASVPKFLNKEYNFRELFWLWF